MEDFKDVMLSEPPKRYAGASAAPATTNALSLESYKGILLCDRPADVRAARGGSNQPAFLPPGNTDTDRGNGNLGLPPSVEQRSKIATNLSGRGDTQTRKAHTALSKHRKWLSSFAAEVKKMQTEQSAVEIRQSVREAALREREATKRRDGIAASTTAVVGVPATSPVVATSAAKPPKATAPATTKTKAKPKWAMTEEEAEDAEFAEARDLMDFAAELDFDSFMKDFEVQEALAIMRDRVKEIAAEKGIDLETARRAMKRRAADEEDDDSDAASVATASTTTREVRRAQRRAVKAAAAGADGEDATGSRPGWDDSTNTAIRKALAGDALKLAERVLQSSDALRKVHSKLSMAKLLEDVAMELNAGKSQRQVALPAESVIIPPRIAIVAAEATGASGVVGAPQPQKRILTEMRHSKSQAQNLPYLYRCPSI